MAKISPFFITSLWFILLNLISLLSSASLTPYSYFFYSVQNSWLEIRCHFGAELRRTQLCSSSYSTEEYPSALFIKVRINTDVGTGFLSFWTARFPLKLVNSFDSSSQPFAYQEYSLLTHTMDTTGTVLSCHYGNTRELWRFYPPHPCFCKQGLMFCDCFCSLIVLAVWLFSGSVLMTWPKYW